MLIRLGFCKQFVQGHDRILAHPDEGLSAVRTLATKITSCMLFSIVPSLDFFKAVSVLDGCRFDFLQRRFSALEKPFHDLVVFRLKLALLKQLIVSLLAVILYKFEQGVLVQVDQVGFPLLNLFFSHL